MVCKVELNPIIILIGSLKVVFLSFNALINEAEIETKNFVQGTNQCTIQPSLIMDIVELFFSYKRDSKEMHFIYDYGNYNWKEKKKKKKKTFIKNFCVQYI